MVPIKQNINERFLWNSFCRRRCFIRFIWQFVDTYSVVTSCFVTLEQPPVVGSISFSLFLAHLAQVSHPWFGLLIPDVYAAVLKVWWKNTILKKERKAYSEVDLLAYMRWFLTCEEVAGQTGRHKPASLKPQNSTDPNHNINLLPWRLHVFLHFYNFFFITQPHQACTDKTAIVFGRNRLMEIDYFFGHMIPFNTWIDTRLWVFSFSLSSVQKLWINSK